MSLYNKSLLISSAVKLLQEKFRSKIVKYDDIKDLVWIMNLRKDWQILDFSNCFWLLWEYQFFNDRTLFEKFSVIWVIKKIWYKKFDIIFDEWISDNEQRFLTLYLIWISLFSDFKNWVESVEKDYIDTNFRYRIWCWFYKKLLENEIENTKEELAFQIAIDASIDNDFFKRLYLLKDWNFKELSKCFLIPSEILIHKLYETRILNDE